MWLPYRQPNHLQATQVPQPLGRPTETTQRLPSIVRRVRSPLDESPKEFTRSFNPANRLPSVFRDITTESDPKAIRRPGEIERSRPGRRSDQEVSL